MSTSSIAILKPDHLGDLVLSVPAIRAVRARYRNITLFVASSSRPLAGFLFPDIEDIRSADLPHLARNGEAHTPPGMLIDELNRFDHVLSLRHDTALHLLVSRLGVPRTSVGDGGHLVHESATQQRAAESLCGPYSRTRLFSGLPHEWPVAPRHVALCISAGFPTNRWATVCWAELGTRLGALGIRLTLVGGPVERDELRMLSRLLGHVPHDVLVGSSDFAAFFAALEPVDLVIATDSGTAHICSLHKPVCSLFGSSPWRRYAPFGRGNVVVTREEPCSPCVQFSVTQLNGCLTRECLARIHPATVLRVVLSNGFDFSGVRGVRVERGASHRNEPPAPEPRLEIGQPMPDRERPVDAVLEDLANHRAAEELAENSGA